MVLLILQTSEVLSTNTVLGDEDQYVHLLSTSCPPDVTHMISVSRPSPFFTALPFLCIILNGHWRTKTGKTWEWGNFLAVCTWLSIQEVYCHQTMSHACFLITIRQWQSSRWSGHLTQFTGVSANTYLSYLVIDRWSPIINNVVMGCAMTVIIVLNDIIHA